MTLTMKLLTTITLSLTLILISCYSPNTDEQTTVKQQPASTTKVKVQIFNDIAKTRTSLSQNGIGQLKDWRSDEMGGYMSITDYYQFGDSPIGLKNNIAYYLESDNANCVKTAKLVLNINNKAENKEALKQMKEISEATFKSLSLETPKGLLEAITKEKNFQDENESYKTTLKLDRSKIDTWQLTIETK